MILCENENNSIRSTNDKCPCILRRVHSCVSSFLFFSHDIEYRRKEIENSSTLPKNSVSSILRHLNYFSIFLSQVQSRPFSLPSTSTSFEKRKSSSSYETFLSFSISFVFHPTHFPLCLATTFLCAILFGFCFLLSPLHQQLLSDIIS